MQVFHLQQRMLGEIVTVREENVDRCMRYSEFIAKWDELNSNDAFQALVMFLEELDQTCERRWRRLELMREALEQLYQECKELLQLGNVDDLRK